MDQIIQSQARPNIGGYPYEIHGNILVIFQHNRPGALDFMMHPGDQFQYQEKQTITWTGKTIIYNNLKLTHSHEPTENFKDLRPICDICNAILEEHNLVICYSVLAKAHYDRLERS